MNDIIDAIWFSECFNFNRTNQFKLASGLFSPIYIDLRKLIYYPVFRHIIIIKLTYNVIQVLRQNANYRDVVISCRATADIPFASIVAENLGLPLVYIREPKPYGLGQSIEGGSVVDKNIIHISDLVTTGLQFKESYKLLKTNNANIIGLVSIINRSEKVKREIELLGLDYFFILSLTDLIKGFKAKSFIDETLYNEVLNYINNE